MAGCMADCRSKIESTSRLSASQIAYLKRTIAEAQAGGATVTVWLTGPHPRTAAHMSEGTAYRDLVREAQSLLGALGPNVRTFDFHDQSAYGGASPAWYDCNHFDDTHAQLIEKKLVSHGI